MLKFLLKRKKELMDAVTKCDAGTSSCVAKQITKTVLMDNLNFKI